MTDKIEETKKPEEKKEAKTEREFIIPLRRKFIKTAKYRRAPKAIRTIKEFLVRHMKSYDRDLKKIRLERYLNEFIWTRGIKNPPSKVKVRAFIDGDFIRTELAELPEGLRFRKEKLEKRKEAAAAVTPKEKVPETPAEVSEKTEEQKAEEKEKKAAVVEAGLKMEKAVAKQKKHMAKISKQPKRQRRMALEK